MLWASEYGRILRGQTNACQADGNLQLTSDDFDAVLTLLDEASLDDAGLDPFFKYSRRHGLDCLTVQQFVGVIRTETGQQIEILPKVSRKVDVVAARHLLVKMLIELKDSPFKEGTLADLDAHDMSLFEVLMRQFLGHVGDIVRQGIARSYVSREDNLVYLRGKLQLTKHIRRNIADQSRVYCQYDEYEIDRPINRLIKGALEVVNLLSEDATNQQLCREFLFWFHNVPATSDSAADFRAARRDRLVRHYEPAMPTCKLILEGLNPLTQKGDRRAVSMLFPMERVFESYVAAKLSRSLSSWSVNCQVRGQALIERHIDGRMFGLVPDLEFVRGDERVVADTKWKLLNQADRKNRYGISQSDIYQLFAYSRKYLKGHAQRRVVLIYPKTDAFTLPLRPFWYEQNHEVLHVLPYDLESDELVMDSDFFLRPVSIANRQLA